MKIKFKAAHLLVTYFFAFRLLLKYKTNFPVIIDLPQHFTATISAKLCSHVFFQWFPIANVLRAVQGTWTRNAPQLWPGVSNLAICRSSWQNTKRKIDLNIARVKNQMAVFQLGTFLLQKVETGEGLKLTWNIWQLHETAFDSFVVVFQWQVGK